MAWQGIPYPSFISNTIDAGLTVTKIPEIIVDTGIGWDTIFGSVLAAFIGAALPTAVAWYTIKKNDDLAATDRDNQRHIAEMAFDSQVLSTNRQQWINTLRSYCSEFIMSCEKNKRFRRLHSAERDEARWNNGTNEKANEYFAVVVDSEHRILELATNIQLMLNPHEWTSKAILKCQENMIFLLENENIYMFYEDDSEVEKAYRRLKRLYIKSTQRCLKTEWKRVKLRQ
ncbi:TPA: hypothetical protein PCC25_004680 [Klebsiella quasipneumoniae]|uniref:hypothetical protein n=1 Tax=Klebsiella TaxID=570 RepID=UPI001083BB10|nr:MULTISPECIES: hypothetical protein [Klebsiella]KAA3443277.1 hypothetical protein BHE81_09845 [Klebsiella sp. AqSCr]MBK0711593.1 hypothetical protein [Klebsiella pneumoniae]MCQ3848637.1 hypothetical protein [Klebsiella variicola]MCU4141189.1 hypothetical protein [Klebsiella quasipneumoniae]MCU4151664.1 hypothetical protein [Klebsiella quasipneumoniae]